MHTIYVIVDNICIKFYNTQYKIKTKGIKT